jgi:hypothetical protein
VRNHNAAEEGRTQEQLELYFKAGFLDLPYSAQSDKVAKIRFPTLQNVAIRILLNVKENRLLIVPILPYDF